MREGGCFCGFVRYAIEGPVTHETCCHCSICRRTSGAPFVAWLTVSRGSLCLTGGEPRRFRSSPHGTRSFCPRCGTPLTFESDRLPEEIDVTSCSLDDAEALPPRDHTFAGERLAWVRLADGLPTWPAGRS